MILYPPLKKASYFGWFHELKSLGDFNKCITQRFGENPQVYGPKGHNGIDIACPNGTEIFASHDGECSYYEELDEFGNFKGYGRYLVVRDRNNGFKTEYCHLDKVVKTGLVKVGELIGHSDNTGFSSGPHLHWTLKVGDAVDPLPHLVWFNTMTEQEVKNIYKLAFYRLPDASELAFWVGKNLDTFLTTAITDRANFLNQPL